VALRGRSDGKVYGFLAASWNDFPVWVRYISAHYNPVFFNCIFWVLAFSRMDNRAASPRGHSCDNNILAL
jgi:hypothetical protein